MTKELHIMISHDSKDVYIYVDGVMQSQWSNFEKLTVTDGRTPVAEFTEPMRISETLLRVSHAGKPPVTVNYAGILWSRLSYHEKHAFYEPEHYELPASSRP
jgi:hypothetical protein